MPIMRVETWEGITKAQKLDLVQSMTETACRVLGCPREAVSVIIVEIPKENWGAAGELCSERFPDQ
ncbi:tautomerase family protein [Salidesulfovibrio onnuriiensis]|uniref:tautomerase family protein n=1 Tax=Salidesulfovibrio onnuriiensis TaxID=2583823 RepID=UPI0011CC757A|nr:2-hydroxymuconate tautomerase family protein [Salidesulfovibrio onnuriiensis]